MRRSALLLCATFVVSLASCSQQVTMPVTQPPVSSIVDYFWNRDTTLSLRDSTAGSTASSKITFTIADGLLQDDDVKAGSIHCDVNADSVFASGFTAHSVIDLDPNSYFSGLETQRLVAHELHTMCFFDNNPEYPFVATDTGIFRFNYGAKQYTFLGLNVPDIQLLSFNSNTKSIYAATASDTIWMCSDTTNANWRKLTMTGLPKGRILAMAGFVTTYVAAEGTRGVY